MQKTHKHKHTVENKLFITFSLVIKKRMSFFFAQRGKMTQLVSVWAQMTLTHRV